MPKTKCSKFKTTREHHDNLGRDDFDESSGFRHEGYDGECDSSNYPPSMTIKCNKCDECFNPDVSGLDGVCDTCHVTWKDMPKPQPIVTLGWWELKPEEQLSAYEMLQFGGKDDGGDNMVELLDIIEIDVEDGYKFSEVDEEHITNQIRRGCTSGEINDWDWKSEQELEVMTNE